MKKVLIILITIVVVIVVIPMFIQHSPDTDMSTEKTIINIGSLKGPTSIGLLKLMEDGEKGDTSNNYVFTVTGTADELTAKLAKGELDIVTIPSNLASVLYNNNQNISVVSINTLNVLYVLETSDKINSISDLRGKTVYMTGKGTVPEYTFNYLLEAAGITDEVTIEYKTEPSEVAALLNQGKATIAILPQPYATTVKNQNPNLRIALDLGKEWDNIQQDNIPIITGVTVVRKEFLENNKEAIDNFLSEYKNSIEYVNTNIEDVAKLSGEFDIIPLSIAKDVIPQCNVTYIDGQDMRDMIEGYLQILFDKNPKSVGGKLPDANFYYKK